MLARRSAFLLAGLTAATLALASETDGRDAGFSVAPLPEVEVIVPSDRTDFTQAPVPMEIAPPELPPVVVAIPDGAEVVNRGADVTVMVPPPALPAAPDLPAAIARPDPAPAPSPEPVIASRPEAPAPMVEAAKPAPTPTPAVAAFAPAREALDAAFDSLWRVQPLPNPVMQGIKAFYEANPATALWASAEGLTPRGEAVLDLVERSGEHGLDPARYRKIRALTTGGTPETREVAVSILAALYARDARGGRINPQQISRLVTATPTLPDTASVLEGLRTAPDTAGALERYNPQHEGYRALRQRLADLRATTASVPAAPARLTHGALLTLGMSDERVPLLRDLLSLPAGPDQTYDRALVDAVKAVQREKGLRVTGRLDRRTVAALGGVDDSEARPAGTSGDLIANMERWRWLPVDLGENHVFVNIPSYSLTLKRGSEIAMQTRVVVGKPQTPTPVFSDRMQFLVVNPYWNVPPSIAMKELLPLLQANPYALQARGLEVVSRGRVVDPATVNWSGIGRSVAIRQPPGARNALGHIKFMFPNEHAVYLHDTPSRALFANDRRAYSHGCVRVQNPFQLAEAILGDDWSEKRLRGMVGGPERQVPLASHLPVHLAYFTTYVDETGTLQTRDDIYGHNRKVRTLLGV